MSKILITALTIVFFINYSQAQEYFSVVNVEKKIAESEKWNFLARGHWKKYYDTESWNRVGVDAQAIRKLDNWKFLSGIVTNYTYDKTISNYWEIRPWVGISLKNTVYADLKFSQTFKYEVQNFKFSEGNTNTKKSISRTQYIIKPTYELNEKWELFTEYVWYFLSEENFPIRFLSSREWNLGVSRSYQKFKMEINYSREKFNEGIGANRKNANTLNITLSF